MFKSKKKVLLWLSCLIALTVVLNLIFMFSPNNSYTQTVAAAQTNDSNSDDTVAPCGLVTRLTLTIGAEDGTVWANVHNDFTLGSSTIAVYVELYSSETYQEDHTLMTLESRNYISDLNWTKYLETSAPINGVQRYWLARMRYKFDSRDWVIKQTQTYLFDEEGYLIA